jgi:N-acetylglucosaminyldiphosphoundecaprenol N-acetyl-beta-D-mannosaminyltransferase
VLAIETPPKQAVLGVGISTTTYRQVKDLCDYWIQQKRSRGQSSQENSSAKYICVTSVHGIITAFWDRDFRRTLNAADVATPDGMPVVWAVRSFGNRKQTRVYGPDLMLSLCERAAEAGHRIFFYGARADTLEALENNLRSRFPGLVVAGRFSPPFRPLTPDEDQQVAKLILGSGADLVFVGLSTPKQEQWMINHRLSLRGTIMIGVGAAFDFHAGKLRQAPAWMQRSGLEWLFRLCREPRRLWKRYLLITPVFLPLWAMQKARILRYH